MAVDLPEFDPRKKGIYEGYLRLSFIKAMDKIASDEISEFTEIVYPVYLALSLPKTVRFCDLRRRVENRDAVEAWGGHEKLLGDYVDRVIEWAKKYDVDCNWYLDELHERLGFFAMAEFYYRNQIERIKAAQPFTKLLRDYSSIKKDQDAIRDRGSLIEELFELLEIKNVADVLKLKTARETLREKPRAEISKLESKWKEKRIREIEIKRLNLMTLNLHYGFTFMLEANDLPFVFESRPWRFNEESRKAYRKKVTKQLSRHLTVYFNHMASLALEKGYKKVDLLKKRYHITPEDRMELFVMYQVKKWSPEKCLRRLQDLFIAANRPYKHELDVTSIPKMALKFSRQLGLRQRISKTRKSKKIELSPKSH